ncbi:glycosyltransferase family 4 protein [Bacteroides clarus]|uniref:glycosyltransferase family 4 protein n=1 Tax=Bacteroides clarus TaxID=626929 RepID=UPI00248EA093|nr:glycosyltransferase family 4 protein [Bacteroides clarus]
MKIIVASLGRAHLLDCARELQAKGHDVVFYSATPPKNFIRYGLDYGGKSLIWYVFPFYILKRLFPNNFTQKLYRLSLDILVKLLMTECDVFIAQSPNFQRSILSAKRKYNALTILDRGSTHVRSFNRLSAYYGKLPQSETYQRMDEYGYSIVDCITVASEFVFDTFKENFFDVNKIFINPYGVNLSMFYPVKCSNEFDCIIVGQWGTLKGCSVIVEAFKQTSIKVLHVGALTDMEFPQLDNFVHISAVPETELINYYKKAKVFIFPSYNDGYGLVLNQAVACGLPIVCSKKSGGPTLKKMIRDEKYIYIMNEITTKELLQGVDYALNIAAKQRGKRKYDIDIDDIISWKAYGERYHIFLENKISSK